MTGPTGVAGGTTAARDVGDLVRRLEADAIGRLTAAAGNDSLCTLSRSGEPRPAAKYHEGAAAALAQVRRAVDKAPDHDPTVTARTVRHRWTANAGTAGAAPQTPRPGTPVSQLPTDEASGPLGAARSGGGPTTITLRGRGRWPRRRAVATAALTPALFAALAATGGGWQPGAAPLWTALVALTALASAATLATYLPQRGQGWRPDLDCSPCAAMSAGSVLAAAWLLGSAPLQPAMAVVALATATFGLTQRLSGTATTCST